jgi:hypothetical protein
MVLLIKQNMMQQLMQLKMLPESKNDAAQLVRDEAKKVLILSILKIKEYLMKKIIQQIMHYKQNVKE